MTPRGSPARAGGAAAMVLVMTLPTGSTPPAAPGGGRLGGETGAWLAELACAALPALLGTFPALLLSRSLRPRDRG